MNGMDGGEEWGEERGLGQGGQGGFSKEEMFQ